MVEIMDAGRDPMHDDDPSPEVTAIDSTVDMFSDDTPIEGQCDLENPESCEACD